MYSLLALVFGSILAYRRKRLQVSWYWYIILAFVDVQGNYAVIKAYQFTSITSVTLLDCWTIPWVIILTWVFLGTRYSLWKFLGAAICVAGLALVLLSDAGVAGGGGGKPLLGDMLVIAGTLCYAFSNVGEEYCVKKKDQVEVVAMLGAFGVLISICEICIFEKEDLKSIKWSSTIICLFVGFAFASFLFYTVVPFVLKMSGATLFNLSTLTSDLWVVIIRIFFYHQEVDWLYYLAFIMVAVGLCVYSISAGTIASTTTTTTTSDQEENIPYQLLNEENVNGVSEVNAN